MRGIVLYALLDRVFPNSYKMKLFCISFLGTHAPLFALLSYAWWDKGATTGSTLELALVVGATAVGSGIAIIGIWLALAPIELATEALGVYGQNRTILPLDTRFRDTAGQLLRSVDSLLGGVESLISDRERLAFSDPLTGLLNRRGFEQIAGERLGAVASGGSTSLAIFDLDHFKQINDEFGHLAGDEALRGFAEVLRERVPAGDVAARIGGEEFAVLFFEASESEVVAICNLVRRSIAQRRLVSRPVTTSVGVASQRGSERIPELLARADRALYAAKRGGRDRVIQDRPQAA